MDEIDTADVIDDQQDKLTLVTSYLTGFLRAKAVEWYCWDVALEVISDGYTVEVVYPEHELLQGRRRIQAEVLLCYLGRYFDLQGTLDQLRPKSFAL